MKLSDASRLVQGTVYGKRSFVIRGVSPPEEACASDLTFLFDPEAKTNAGAVVARVTKTLHVKNTTQGHVEPNAR